MGKIKLTGLRQKTKKFFSENKPLTYFLIFLAGLAVIAGAPYLKEGLSKIKFPPREYKVSKTVVSTTLNESQAKRAVEFIQLVYTEPTWPLDLVLEQQEADSQSVDEQHYGAWSSLGRVYNILYVKGSSSEPKYLRTWIFGPAEELNDALAKRLLGQFFKKDYLDQVGEPSCSSQEEPEKFTVCSALKIDSAGDKIGVLLHSPFKLQDGSQVSLISACLLPKGSDIFSGPNTCF
jgi:hypothetical protein